MKKLIEKINPAKVIFCAGSRNSSLLTDFSDYECEFHFDERSACFKALGMAKVLSRPIVVCVTSGTAVAECLPAMIEAYYSKLPLIIISGDRPERLRFTHAPQAINQVDIFKDFTRSSYTGGKDDCIIDSISYPIHLNIEIDDCNIPYENGLEDITSDSASDLINKYEKVVAVFTENHTNIFESFLAKGIICYRESVSNIKKPYSKNEIRYEKDLLGLLKNNKVDLIIKVGEQTPITKAWRLLDTQYTDIPVVVIDGETSGLGRGLFTGDISFDGIVAKTRTTFDHGVTTFLEKFPKAEVSIFNSLINKIREDELVVLGNSMPIRYWELVHEFRHHVYVNRGANGIDGLVATAIGIAESSNKETHLILGDLSLLYDLNNLWWNFPENLTIHCINNFGGKIFSRVNVPTEMKTEHTFSFDTFNHPKLIEYRPCDKQTEAFWSEWVK